MSIHYAVRQLVDSNLGWFHRTRETLGESTGRERAININRDVFDEWFSGRSVEDESPIDVTTNYYDGSSLDGTRPHQILMDQRTIRKQGGGKNWRLAGDAVQGRFYDVRSDDLMFIAFDQSRNLLSWVIVRKDCADRPVPPDETATHAQIVGMLGAQSGNMWRPNADVALKAVTEISKLYPPNLRALLMVDRLLIEEWESALTSIGFISESEVARRLPLALKSKPFVILTGLSGSGKTLLGRAFAHWLCESADQFAVIPVGANWVSNENIMGYADALTSGRYCKTRFLEVLLRADRNPAEPHFIILDEMNLSHVERYFADLLSAIESPTEPVRFHDGIVEMDGVPAAISGLPSNLHVIGTVNVDETTYMFSPKVLDRAQVIEFRTSSGAVNQFLKKPAIVALDKIKGKGTRFATHFVESANDASAVEIQDSRIAAIVGAELNLLFGLLSDFGQEIGFRSISQILRLVEHFRRFSLPASASEIESLCRAALDAALIQKLLPRLSGSRRRLYPLLQQLIAYCALPRTWSDPAAVKASPPSSIIANYADVIEVLKAVRTAPAELPGALTDALENPFYRLSCAKLLRMRERLEQDGFASFAEA